MALAVNAQATLETSRGTIHGIADWFAANIDRLPIGLAAAAAIIGVMLLVRWAGVAMRNSDPDCARLRGVIGRVLAKTGVLFMAATAIEVIATYADVPPKIGRIADILFIIAFAIQGAVWARELILGAIARRVGEDTGESTLANAMSLIRVLVSVALFTIALIVILDNLGVNVTALVAGLGIGGIAIGLAAQGIFSDLFAALAIVFD
jgi:small-conductance mechanosensitive channel